MPVPVPLEGLVSVAPPIWETMLALPLEYIGLAPVDFGEATRTITGLVTVAGEWTGAFTLQTTTEAASAFAEAMFMADPGSLDPAEVRDAHAELTNMTGGNIKNLLPGVCRLSVPTVTEGKQYDVRLPRTAPTHLLHYRSGEHDVALVVIEPVALTPRTGGKRAEERPAVI